MKIAAPGLQPDPPGSGHRSGCPQ